MDEPETDAGAWDEDAAERLIGAKVLIGLTRRSATDEPDQLEQMHGEVVSADRGQGVCIRLHGVRDGEDYWLPPDLRAFRPAPPGTYRLRSTGEEIIDPDFVTNWTIDPPRH